MQSKRLAQRATLVTVGLATLALAGNAWAQRVDFKPKAETWYLQTVATTANGLKDDRSGVIGRIPEGADGKDKHDIPAFASVNGAPIAVISVRGEEWGEDAGEYLSDYRAPGKGRAAWNFVVTSNDPTAQVTLSWEGLYLIEERPEGGFDTRLANDNRTLRSLRLIDLDKGRVVRRGIKRNGQIKPYTFRMDGQNERHFRWVAGKPTAVELSMLDVVALDTVSPQPLNFDAQLTTAGPSGKTRSPQGFSGPPDTGVAPGQGVNGPGGALRPGNQRGVEGGDAGATANQESLFKPVIRSGKEIDDR